MLTMSDGLVALSTIMIAFSLLYLLVGMIKPRWVLFGMREPNRLVVGAVALLLFMASFTWHSMLVFPKKSAGNVQTRSQQEGAPAHRSH